MALKRILRGLAGLGAQKLGQKIESFFTAKPTPTNIRPGCFVKKRFYQKHPRCAETMWIRVTQVKKNRIYGTLASNPVDPVACRVRHGTRVYLPRWQVMAVRCGGKRHGTPSS